MKEFPPLAVPASIGPKIASIRGDCPKTNLSDDDMYVEGLVTASASDPMWEQHHPPDRSAQHSAQTMCQPRPSLETMDRHRASQLQFNESALRHYNPVLAQLPPRPPAGSRCSLRRTSGWSPEEYREVNDKDDEADIMLGHLHLSTAEPHPSPFDLSTEEPTSGTRKEHERWQSKLVGPDIEDEAAALARAMSNDVLLARKTGPEGILAQQRLQAAARRRSSSSGNGNPAIQPSVAHVEKDNNGNEGAKWWMSGVELLLSPKMFHCPNTSLRLFFRHRNAHHCPCFSSITKRWMHNAMPGVRCRAGCIPQRQIFDKC